MAIIPYPSNLAFRSSDDILTACNNGQLTKIVNEKANRYQQINVKDTMDNLIQVGSLLQLAYAGSKGHNCCRGITELIVDFQSLTKDSSVACGAYVNGSLQSLKLHKLALTMAERGNNEKALQLVAKCSELAKTMEDHSTKLVNEATRIRDLSKKTLLDAKDDEQLSNEEKKRVEAMIHQAEEIEAGLKSKTADLEKQIREEKRAEAENARRARSARASARSLSVWSSIPIVNWFTSGPQAKDEENAEIYARKEEEARQKKNECLKEALQSNAQLAACVTNLRNHRSTKNDIQQAIRSLEVSVITLGKVVTTFQNVRKFWIGVEEHCKNLTDMGTIELLAEEADMFIDEIKDSGLSWLALGKITLTASQAIQESEHKIDDVLSNLPSGQQAQQIVNKVSTELLDKLKKDNEQLELEMRNNQN